MHYADSSVLLHQPHIAQKGMRIGILLYGVLPPGIKETDLIDLQFRPVMNVKTNIIQIHNIKKNDSLGYYSNAMMHKDSRIAVIPMGYANGLDRRCVSVNCNVLVNGLRAPLCGNIFMNTSYINISDIPNCRMGDEVVLLGKQGAEEITISEIANKMDTIPAEIMVRMGRANEH